MTEDWGKKVDELKKKYGRLEFCTIDQTGFVTDAVVHDAILSAAGDTGTLDVIRHRDRLAGVSEEEIERRYGKPSPGPTLAASNNGRSLEDTRERARRRGWSEEMIERAYGKPSLRNRGLLRRVWSTMSSAVRRLAPRH
jgi:hypothetical protein